MATVLLILHGLFAVALLGAITHQTLAAWAPPGNWRHSFFARFRGVPAGAFANAIVVLYVASALLGAVVYLRFKVDIQPYPERDRHWHALGFFDLKEDFVAIGLGLLPAYWTCWRPVSGRAPCFASHQRHAQLRLRGRGRAAGAGLEGDRVRASNRLSPFRQEGPQFARLGCDRAASPGNRRPSV